MVEIKLPRPPSVNAMYVPFKGRQVKSKIGRDWFRLAANSIPICYRMLNLKYYGIYILVERCGKVHPDLDNVIKATNDVLQDVKVIQNDKFCEHITMDWLDVPKDKSPEVHIKLKEWKNES